MDVSHPALQALAFLFTANATPWVLSRIFKNRWGAPVDFGCKAWDGERVFGSHKTWRGLIAGTLATGLLAKFLDVKVHLGLGFGALSLSGDLLSSFIKRRLRLKPGAEVFGFDQLFETLLPLLVLASALRLDTVHVVVAVLTFTMLDVLSVRIRQRHFSRA